VAEPWHRAGWHWPSQQVVGGEARSVERRANLPTSKATLLSGSSKKLFAGSDHFCLAGIGAQQALMKTSSTPELGGAHEVLKQAGLGPGPPQGQIFARLARCSSSKSTAATKHGFDPCCFDSLG